MTAPATVDIGRPHAPSVGERLSTGARFATFGAVAGGLLTLSMRYNEYTFETWKAITPRVVGIGALVGATVGLVIGLRAAGRPSSGGVATAAPFTPTPVPGPMPPWGPSTGAVPQRPTFPPPQPQFQTYGYGS